MTDLFWWIGIGLAIIAGLVVALIFISFFSTWLKALLANAYVGFGTLVAMRLRGVPVGLICSAWGGTPAEAWTPNEIIKTQFKNFSGWNKNQKSPQKNPSVLYNGMIHPLTPFTIKGAIWYQGEANKNYYQNYTDIFSSMISSWRKAWNQGEFPFYFVQIAPLGWESKVESQQ